MKKCLMILACLFIYMKGLSTEFDFQCETAIVDMFDVKFRIINCSHQDAQGETDICYSGGGVPVENYSLPELFKLKSDLTIDELSALKKVAAVIRPSTEAGGTAIYFYDSTAQLPKMVVSGASTMIKDKFMFVTEGQFHSKEHCVAQNHLIQMQTLFRIFGASSEHSS